jgi:putative aldouronate transport system permease protein
MTDILDTYVYRSVKTNIDIGIGTAAGLYQSVFGFIIVMLSNYLIKKHNEDYSLF